MYNPGGISGIYLLDIRDFVAYRFREDGLYQKAYVEAIYRSPSAVFFRIEHVNESHFTEEKRKDGVYAQTLGTFVHTLDAQKLEALLVVGVNRYVVVFRTMQDTWFTFGSDGGVSVEFTQITGQAGETNGYAVSLNKESVYPLFEAEKDVLEFKYDTGYDFEFVCEQQIMLPDMNLLICETE